MDNNKYILLQEKIELCHAFYSRLGPKTKLHSKRVGAACDLLAKDCGIEDLPVYMIGVFHDIGKLIIPESILHKPGGLNQHERIMVNMHAFLGGYFLSYLFPEDPEIYLPVYFHHGFSAPKEFVDEYNMEKLKKCWQQLHDTPKIKRCTSLVYMVDYLDACTSKRSYHEATSLDTAIGWIKEKHDPDLYDESLIEKIRNIGDFQKLVAKDDFSLDMEKVTKSIYMFKNLSSEK